MNDDELMSLLRDAHEEALPPAHFTAVRARVMSQVTASRRRLWLRWACAALAAVMVLAAIGLRPARNAPKQVWIAVQPEPLPVVVAPVPAPVVKAAHLRKRRVVKKAVPLAQPLLVKILTDDPDIVIYWLVDGKGD